MRLPGAQPDCRGAANPASAASPREKYGLMRLHEHQAKDLLREAGVPVPRGIVATDPEAAAAAFRSLDVEFAVVKAQIHAGGRGKGGGIQLVRTEEEASEFAASILGQVLVTPQTGPAGRLVGRVLVEEGLDVKRELYVAALIDREAHQIAMIASDAGGMDIEDVAVDAPEKILRETLDPVDGLSEDAASRLADGLGLAGGDAGVLRVIAQTLLDLDASMVEVNPLVVTDSGELYAADAKVDVDDNALFRHPDLEALRDAGEEHASEDEARRLGLSYIAMDGEIGCVVNGAGLAMATMDVLKLHGGSPANFLDVGGSADAEQIGHAFRIVLEDQNVKAIFVNIFGGILRCDTLAEGLIAAATNLGVAVPLVVRLEGTNNYKGRELLAASSLDMRVVSTVDEGAREAVAAAGGGS